MGFAGILGVAAAALILLGSPTALGAVAIAPVVLSAPYHGVTTGISTAVQTSGCGGASVPVKAFFNATRGVGGFMDKASAPTCQNPAGSSGASSSTFITEIPVRVHTGSHTFTVVTSIQAKIATHLTAGTCTPTVTGFSECAQYADASLYGFVYVYDETNASYYYSSNYWSGATNFTDVFSYCSAGNCSTGSFGGPGTQFVSTTFSFVINASALVGSHHYQVVAYFSGYADASSGAFGTTLHGGFVSAAVNVASSGYGVDVASITVT